MTLYKFECDALAACMSYVSSVVIECNLCRTKVFPKYIMGLCLIIPCAHRVIQQGRWTRMLLSETNELQIDC